MLNSPFQYETWLTPAEYQKLGELSLRWSHLDHIIGNCLSAMLKLTAEQAVIVVFPLSTQIRLQRLKELARLKRIRKDGKAALEALVGVMEYINKVRNNAIHAILIEDDTDGAVFHLRSKRRTITKEQLFSIEELTNYAAHAALALSHALDRLPQHALPDRPDIPDFLNHPTPSEIRSGQPLSPLL